MRDDDGLEWWLILGIALLCVFFTYAVISTAQASVNVKVLTKHERDTSLPTKCKEFYNSGTTEWIECQGVGYK